MDGEWVDGEWVVASEESACSWSFWSSWVSLCSRSAAEMRDPDFALALPRPLRPPLSGRSRRPRMKLMQEQMSAMSAMGDMS